ncbi:unnamed protein product [Brassicogethes aeneus]|uniref:Uncharacterized protein n=1 Tax=Brassicogethes aeneus TaxID=1431903 RepID=A0A9P0BH48_BRAAE|nr:unnamed protein product [Brassicogethes aeneus]
MSVRRCYFKTDWLTDPNFNLWVEECKSNSSVIFCKICKKNVDISNMGVSALKSHMKSVKHIKLTTAINSTTNVAQYFQNHQLSNSSLGIEKPSSSENKSRVVPEKTLSLQEKGLISEAVLKSEIIWTINMVLKHYSFNSSKNNGKLFSAMFPDSEIAKSFACGATKMAYTLCFGISPFIKEKLLSKIRKSKHFTAYFDGSVDKYLQKDQIDVIIRFWDESQITSRYMSSAFLGHAKASDIIKAIKNEIAELNSQKLLQIGMDGPNVNLKVLKEFVDQRRNENEDYPQLIDIGSCSIHTLHRSFQVAVQETGWDLASILRGLWQIFKDSPARRSDFEEISKNKIFPLKFCATRWTEDVSVAERAIQIWPDVCLFVSSYKDKPRSATSCQSFQTIKKATNDPLLVAKLSFFSFVGGHLKTYLTLYQTDAPMIPFQANDIMELLFSIASLFIKRDILDKMENHKDLCSVDVKDSKNVVLAKDVEIGFSTKKYIKDSLKENKIMQQRLDIFYSNFLQNKNEYVDLWDIIKIILTLSHGQASVERGFSVNKEITVENLSEKALQASRLVYDEYKNKDISKLNFEKELLSHVRSSRMRYQNYLDDEKTKKTEDEKTKKRTKVLEEVNELKKKKIKLEKTVETLNKDADELARNAEKKSDFTLLAKSNAFRNKSKETLLKINSIANNITELSKKIT